jgi:hypothetical protein
MRSGAWPTRASCKYRKPRAPNIYSLDIRRLGLPKSDRKPWTNATFFFSRTTSKRPGLESSIKATRDHHELGFQRGSGCGRADPARAALAKHATAAAGVATLQEPTAAAGPVRACPILWFPWAPWGCDGCSGCTTVEPTRVGGLIRHGRTTMTMADKQARGSGGIRRGRGASLADAWAGKSARTGCGSSRRTVGRFRRGQKGPRRADYEFAVGRRTRRRHR